MQAVVNGVLLPAVATLVPGTTSSTFSAAHHRAQPARWAPPVECTLTLACTCAHVRFTRRLPPMCRCMAEKSVHALSLQRAHVMEDLNPPESPWLSLSASPLCILSCYTVACLWQTAIMATKEHSIAVQALYPTDFLSRQAASEHHGDMRPNGHVPHELWARALHKQPQNPAAYSVCGMPSRLARLT